MVVIFFGKMGPVLFARHPVLMAIGAIGLATNGVLAYLPRPGWEVCVCVCVCHVLARQ